VEENKEIQQETTEVAEEVTQNTVEDTTNEVSEQAEEGKETKRPQRKSRRRKIETVERVESEWKEQLVQLRRVTKVVKGGKKLSFRAIVITGNRKGSVGMGVAKAAEVSVAIQKAGADARKNLITVPIFNTTIPHEIQGKSGAGAVKLRPASKGTGVIAGGAVRAVLELAGIENILSKSLGSKSPLNAANATLNALKSLRTFKDVAAIRGISVKEMLGQK
jgi:small subunit ribosomal protein S5